MITNTSLLRLLQLSSASLPVGGYSFSQGLEYAIDEGWLKTEKDIADWISLVMDESLAQVDLPLLLRLSQAVDKKDSEQFYYWNAYTLACRETMELHLTEVAMGEALVRLLNNLNVSMPENTGEHASQVKKHQTSFIAAFATAASAWNIDRSTLLVGYLWSWLENQIAAATKIVPLGQTSAQRLLVELGEKVEGVIEKANNINDEDIGSSLPGLAMASSWHETQYSRLFRS